MAAVRCTFLLLLALLTPALRADWVVVDYDAQADWIAFDFVGWVRVEGAEKAPVQKGNAALRLRVLEKLAGADPAPALRLEYVAPVRQPNGEIVNPDGHAWHQDVGRGTEYLVFLHRLPNGAYWCDDLRAFPVVDGVIKELPKTYEVFLGEGVTPEIRAFLVKVRTGAGGLRARVGRPEITPPLAESGRVLAPPAEVFTQLRAMLEEHRDGELERRIVSADRSPTRKFRSWMLQQRMELASCEVVWQAALNDAGMIALAQKDQPTRILGVFFVWRRGGQWQLLSSMPENDAGRVRLEALLASGDFVALAALYKRDHPAP